MFRRKKKRRRNPNSGADGDGDDDDVAADAMTAMAAETASVVSLYPEYCQRSNEEDAFLEIAQDFGDDPIVPQKLPPPPPGFQVRFNHCTETF